VSLKTYLERELAIPIRVRAGAPGSFVVLLNGQPIYSKKQTGHSPAASEIMGLIREKASQQ
jgi:selT/selW/selH-like putative selenoprotein